MLRASPTSLHNSLGKFLDLPSLNPKCQVNKKVYSNKLTFGLGKLKTKGPHVLIFLVGPVPGIRKPPYSFVFRSRAARVHASHACRRTFLNRAICFLVGPREKRKGREVFARAGQQETPEKTSMPSARVRANMRREGLVLPTLAICQIHLPTCWRMDFMVLPKIKICQVHLPTC